MLFPIFAFLLVSFSMVYHLQKSGALNLDVGVQGQSLDGDTSRNRTLAQPILLKFSNNNAPDPRIIGT